jgi:pentatricopeptide repeat protein
MAFTIDISFFLNQLAVALYSLKIEIVIFVAAFTAHSLLFGKYSLISRKKGNFSNETSKKARESAPAPIEKDVANVPVTAEDVCKGCAGRPEAVAANLHKRLADIPAGDVSAALVGLLQSAGRAPQVDLLSAVRTAAVRYSLDLNSDLGEMLLRGYYACHLTSEFNALLEQVEASANGYVFSGVGVQALKGLLRKADFDAALRQFASLSNLWSKETGPDGTPSAAPKALLQWLGRLALQQDRLDEMLQKMKQLGFLQEAFPLILPECIQHGGPDALANTEAFGRKEKLTFTDAAFCTLIKGAEDAARAMSLFSEACPSSADASKELFVAAAASAFTHKSKTFGDAILEKMPVGAPSDAAGKVFQLCAGAKSSDGEVLDLYLKHFSKIDLSGDSSTEQLIAEACIRANRHDMLKQMLESNNDCTKRVALIKHFGSAGRLDEAFLIFRTFNTKGACLYNAIIDICIDGQRPATAQDMMEEAIHSGMADIVTYNTIIKAHLLAGKTAEAQETVKLMRTAGLEPNCVTFNELLDACIKQQVGEVWAILAEMQSCGVKPNHITGSILLKTIQHNTPTKNIERVLEVLDSLSEGMDEVLLSSVVEAFIRKSRVDLLIPYLKRQTSSRKVQLRGAHTYGSIIRAYGFVNDVNGAWDTWREMRTRHIVPTAVTVGCMVEAVCTNGDPEAGYELIHELLQDPDCKPLVNAIIYCSVLKGLSHQKKFERLWQVYEEMLGLKLQFSIVTFNTMVDACARCGEMGRIPPLLHSMVSQGIEPNLITYSAILKGYCQENRLDEAFELMRTCSAKFKPDEIMYNTLLDGCARQGLYDRGMKLLADMEGAGVRPSNFTLSVLVKMCSRGRRLDRGFEIVDHISSKYGFRVNVHVYSNLIQACTQHRDLRRAFGVLERLLNENVRPDTRTYSLLLKACIAEQESQDAAGLMRAAVGLRGVHPRLMGYSASALQPQGGLPPALISEVIEGIAGTCKEERLAVALLKDIRSKSNIRIDPKLQMRLTTQTVGTTRRAA